MGDDSKWGRKQSVYDGSTMNRHFIRSAFLILQILATISVIAGIKAFSSGAGAMIAVFCVALASLLLYVATIMRNKYPNEAVWLDNQKRLTGGGGWVGLAVIALFVFAFVGFQLIWAS